MKIQFKVALIVLSGFAVSLTTCATKKTAAEMMEASGSSNAPTRVAVFNNNTSGTTTVTLTSPNAEVATFTSVGFGTTSAYQSLLFTSYSGVTVACTAAGCSTGTVIINRNADNTIQIKTGLEPSANPDGNPPTVSSTSPANNASSVAINSTVVVTFSEPMQTTTLTTNTANTTCSGSLQVSTTAANFASCVQMTSLVASGDSRSFTLTPNANLANTTFYKIRVTTAATDRTAVAATAFTTGTGFETSAVADTTFPSAATLSSPSKSQTTVDLQWTETGDDAAAGQASSYELRYSNSAITAGNFSSAILVVSGTPGAPGNAGSRTVSGLAAGIPYHFMHKICDEVPNCAFSNNLSVTTDAATTTTTGAW